MKQNDYTPEKRLMNAIVLQAYNDLVYGYEHLNSTKNTTRQKAKRYIADSEAFLNSEYLQLFTNINGKDIIKMAKETAYKEIIDSAKKLMKHCANMQYCANCPFSTKQGDSQLLRCTLAVSPMDYESELWHKGVIEDNDKS